MRNFYKFTCVVLFSICAKAQVPTATIVSTSTLFCTGSPASFTATGTATDVALAWSITPSRAATVTSASNEPSFDVLIANPGTFIVHLNLSGPTGTNTVSKTISVARSAKASFNASLSGQGFPAQLMLTNYSLNSTKNYWVFDGNSAQKDSSATLVKNYSAAGNYTVTLIALGTGGCNDVSDYVFRIADSSGVTLPNVFSPNNDDINDVFRPIARGILKLNAWVYNRNGVMIASWDKVNGFWDGYTTGGELCSQGEYFVVVEATGFDGKNYKLKGSLTLSR